MKRIFAAVIVLVLLTAVKCAFAEPPHFVGETYAKGDVKLFYKGAAADVYIDGNDSKTARIAAMDFAVDVERVTGKKPAVKRDARLGRNAVIIGTIGKSALVDELAAKKKIDISGVRGKWETFMIATAAAPLPGVEAALVVAGSDPRGTAFGVYELSQQIGVSPWYWWADVKPDRRNTLIVKKGFYKFGPPSVKYRGVFLNDEAFGLNPWAKKTFEPETGDIGPKTYAKVFELLLRLRANYIWPAMKPCTKAFNYYPRNKLVAADYSIVMGSSHCEPMLRDNPDEWPRDGNGENWNYVTNRDAILGYWERRVRENGGFENVYTLGMRGIEDNEMQGDGTLDEKTRRLESIINDQRGLLQKWVNPDIGKVPQLFSPYKEVLGLYQNGMALPEDVTILWTDDNYGYIRRLSAPEEQERPGGSGVYYHISYSGRPHDYLWLCTTPPALIREEMRKAWDYGARSVWVVNVGDIKPAEIGMEFFLQMAWDVDRWDRETVQDYLREWARREFGPKFASEVAGVMNDYYLLNYQRKPEHMGFNEIMLPNTVVQDPEFSLYNYGDEAQRRLDAFAGLTARADAVYSKLPDSKGAAFYELVLYPVRGAALMNRKMLYGFKSREYAKQGRASANAYAQRSNDAFQAILKETEYFNKGVEGGKWKNMMDYRQHDRLVFREAKTGSIKVSDAGGLGVAVEGRAKPAQRIDDSEVRLKYSPAVLPTFNKFTRRKYFIDIFNKGSQPVHWTAVPSADWIRISKPGGTLQLDERLWVDIDYGCAPKGDGVKGEITISGAGAEYTVGVVVFNPKMTNVESGAFVQENGVVSIDAADFGSKTEGDGAAWEIMPGLGLTGRAVAVLPSTAQSISDDMTSGKAPVLEYPIYIFKPGEADVILRAVPTHEITAGRRLRAKASVDDQQLLAIDFAQGNDEEDPVWKRNVLHAAMYGKAKLRFDEGAHTLKIYGVDPSVILDKIIIDFGGLAKSYFGPDVTMAVRPKN